jgi:phosphatidate cytidylyltransferase
VSNLLQRILTAAVGVPIVIWLIYWAPWWAFSLFIVAITAVTAYEYYRIVGGLSRRMRFLGPALSVAIVSVLIAFPEDIRAWISVALLLPLAAFLALLARPGDLKVVPGRVGLFSLGMLYTGVLPSLVALLHRIPDHGPDYVILLLSIAFLGDTGAYTAGRLFGRHSLSPAVSPKKTWEGSVGGLFFSALAALVAHYWYLPELPLLIGLVLGVVLGAMGQVGDLCESMLKRAFDVKDSGQILPGHGGMLDRIDGVIFVATGLYLAKLWIPMMP